MIKDHLLYIDYILKRINQIEEFIANLTKEEFIKDVMRYDAVLYNLQTMAESTQKLPQLIKDRNNHIPWKDIAGFRNILVHNYLEGFNENVLWEIIRIQLPILKKTMLAVQQELEITKKNR